MGSNFNSLLGVTLVGGRLRIPSAERVFDLESLFQRARYAIAVGKPQAKYKLCIWSWACLDLPNTGAQNRFGQGALLRKLDSSVPDARQVAKQWSLDIIIEK